MPDYNISVSVCLISAEEARGIKKTRLYVDTRDFEAYQKFHLSNSYWMDGKSQEKYVVFA